MKPVREQKDDRKVNKICDINSNHFVKFYNDDERIIHPQYKPWKIQKSSDMIRNYTIHVRSVASACCNHSPSTLADSLFLLHLCFTYLTTQQQINYIQ